MGEAGSGSRHAGPGAIRRKLNASDALRKAGGMTARLAPCLAALALLLPAPARADDPTGFDATRFDPPAAQRTVDLGPADTVPGENKQVRCTYYPGFMVKEIYAREVGDAQLSLLPAPPGHPLPPCQQANLADEQVVTDGGWTGYFAGAFSGYAVFTAADGIHGGLGFAVVKPPSPRILYSAIAKGPLTLAVHPPGGIAIGFAAIHAGACSVIAEGAACAKRIAQEVGVAPPDIAMCRRRYDQVKRADTAGWCPAGDAHAEGCVQQQLRAAEWDASPSFLVYRLEVTLDAKGAAAHPAGTTQDCWPSE